MKEYDIQLAIEIEQTAIASNKVLDSADPTRARERILDFHRVI